ncbi:unnamed protein product [Dibothriocephalus latus]|uniref:Uncharacterized protein n=1 Tax=Dibothriocephalus latus TaxID=60516 RepID=A0A3P6U638_DIBLA|nr:unnamed protein product [Dibothriocephalus latus]
MGNLLGHHVFFARRCELTDQVVDGAPKPLALSLLVPPPPYSPPCVPRQEVESSTSTLSPADSIWQDSAKLNAHHCKWLCGISKRPSFSIQSSQLSEAPDGWPEAISEADQVSMDKLASATEQFRRLNESDKDFVHQESSDTELQVKKDVLPQRLALQVDDFLSKEHPESRISPPIEAICSVSAVTVSSSYRFLIFFNT